MSNPSTKLCVHVLLSGIFLLMQYELRCLECIRVKRSHWHNCAHRHTYILLGSVQCVDSLSQMALALQQHIQTNTGHLGKKEKTQGRKKHTASVFTSGCILQLWKVIMVVTANWSSMLASVSLVSLKQYNLSLNISFTSPSKKSEIHTRRLWHIHYSTSAIAIRIWNCTEFKKLN